MHEPTEGHVVSGHRIAFLPWTGRLKVVVVSGIFLLTGCPSTTAEGQHPIRGTVTLDGSPVENGILNLLAVAGGGQRNVSTVIRNGEYDVPRERGPNLGMYRVEIVWHKPIGDHPPNPDVDPPRKQVVPARYNTESILKIEVHDGLNEQNFELTSK